MSQLGVDQKNGPFWGLYYSIFLIVYRGPKGAHNFDQPPVRDALVLDLVNFGLGFRGMVA